MKLKLNDSKENYATTRQLIKNNKIIINNKK